MSSNLEKPAGLGSTVLVATWAECAAGTVLMGLRIYTNAFLTRRWKADFLWASITYVQAISSANESMLMNEILRLPTLLPPSF